MGSLRQVNGRYIITWSNGVSRPLTRPETEVLQANLRTEICRSPQCLFSLARAAITQAQWEGLNRT